jgi:hypothetical protein
MTIAATPLQSPLLSRLPGIAHGFFTRQGGVSKGIYASLNLGDGSDDDPVAVHENRKRIFAWFGPTAVAMLRLYQTHSATAHVFTGEPSRTGDTPEGDAMVTAQHRNICRVLSADCAPILIADAEARVVAAVHAGWRGALGGIVASAVSAMEGLGASRGRMVAAVGPCIGPKSYEVGLEFFDRFLADSPANFQFFRPGAREDKALFDLPAYVLHRLAEQGVGEAEWIGADTCAAETQFFSNRRAVLHGEPDYGRLLSAIMLTP